MTTRDDVRLMKQIYGEDSDEYITALANLPDEPTYQCDTCDRMISEDERRGGVRGGGEGTFCPECCGEATASAPEPAGEWSQHPYKASLIITNVTNGGEDYEIVAETRDAKLPAHTAAQIVADHHAAQTNAMLVEALRDMVDLWTRGQKIINGAPRNVEFDSQVIAARATLKAAGASDALLSAMPR